MRAGKADRESLWGVDSGGALSTGVVIPPPAYFTKVRELCTVHNVMLILDEILAIGCEVPRLLA